MKKTAVCAAIDAVFMCESMDERELISTERDNVLGKLILNTSKGVKNPGVKRVLFQR